ncbi:MAG: hypothetical protein P8166_08735 [Candidatus Thiodiazotropha sp.]
MTLPDTLVGHWEGQTKSIVVWAADAIIDIAVDIQRDGRVSGKVGNAALYNASIVVNRGKLGRLLNIKTDWLIKGKLLGPLLSEGNIRRDSVTMPVNLVDGHLLGGLHSSGLDMGGPSVMRLSTTALDLVRQ